jgi:hypothetical protein
MTSQHIVWPISKWFCKLVHGNLSIFQFSKTQWLEVFDFSHDWWCLVVLGVSYIAEVKFRCATLQVVLVSKLLNLSLTPVNNGYSPCVLLMRQAFSLKSTNSTGMLYIICTNSHYIATWFHRPQNANICSLFFNVVFIFILCFYNSKNIASSFDC